MFSIPMFKQPQPEHWVPNESVTACSECQSVFTVVVRRHHCRRCGDIFCSKCCQSQSELGERVCTRCFKTLSKQGVVGFDARAHADTYIAVKGLQVMEEALFDWPSHKATEFHTFCDKQGMTFVVITTADGVLCGISSEWSSDDKWCADPEAVLFDEKGPHPALKGAKNAVGCFADNGPLWGYGGCLEAGSISSNFGDASTKPSPDYPTRTLEINPLRMTRLQVYRLVAAPPPSHITIRFINKGRPWTRPAPDSTTCQGCEVQFGILTHKHRCRICGDIFCVKCLRNKMCKPCQVPRFLRIDLVIMKRIFAFLPTRGHISLVMTCKFIQRNLPLAGLEYKDLDEWNFASRVQIGRGGCGTVFRCEQDNGQKLAVKIIQKNSVTNFYVWQRIMMEIEIMKMLDHPNIVKFVDAFQTKQDVVIITECAEGGTLLSATDYMRANNINIEHFAAHVMSQLCSALTYMWSVHGIAHRDLKLDNIVLSRDYSKVYVIDFGLAEFSNKTPVKKYCPCGTAGYASPENIYAVFATPCVLTATALTMHKCDMYSLGVILWFVLTDERLFKDTAFRRIRNDLDMGVTCEGDEWEGRSTEAREACQSLLHRDTAPRATAEKFGKNAWVQLGCMEFSASQPSITSVREGEWDQADDGWVFVQYGGFVESSWVLVSKRHYEMEEDETKMYFGNW